MQLLIDLGNACATTNQDEWADFFYDLMGKVEIDGGRHVYFCKECRPPFDPKEVLNADKP